MRHPGIRRSGKDTSAALSSCSSILKCWVQEIVENKQYSGTAVDVWSLGVLLFITVTGHSPYKGKVRRSVHTSDVAAAAADSSTWSWQTHNDMLRAIMRARLPTSAPGWAELSTELQDLISVMLQVIPRSRLH